jgi:DNA-binding Lrp family transcriptional regulator
MTEKTFTPDGLDQLLLQALELDGRIPFARLAEIVGRSEQTVARRFRRMRDARVLRVIGLIDTVALGESTWVVRIQSRPDAALALADALARRSDVGWVSVTSGGSEISCVARSRSSRDRDELLLQRLPKTAQVTGISAQAMLHRFDVRTSWLPGPVRLTPEQEQAVLRQADLPGASAVSHRSRPAEDGGRPPVLDAEDDVLLAELARDGRAAVSALAAATGWSQARTARRIDELTSAGLLYFDTEIAIEMLGFRSLALMSMSVGAADLLGTGRALAQHPEVAFVAATTGSSNLFASVVCRDSAHLFRYVSEDLGALPAIRQLEISPILRRVKAGGTLMDGERLALP